MRHINWQKLLKEHPWLDHLVFVVEILAGCAIFALGFNLFMAPHDFNVGGLSGIAMLIVQGTGWGSVGMISGIINIPLFIIGGKKIGLKFFVGSIIGGLSFSLFLELFSYIPAPDVDPIMAIIYGGLMAGAGAGLVYRCGASTGGSDILVRLLKRKWRNMPIGKISLTLDFAVLVMTGVVYNDISAPLYSGASLFVLTMALDAVVYSFDYSKVAIIISPKYEEIAHAINNKMDRGVTYLYGQGYYLKKDTNVILTAVKKQQLSELKELASSIDPNVFMILQESHQVLGDGFSHYDKNSL